MNEGLNALVLFIGLVLVLTGFALWDETRPPTEQQYRSKEKEFWRWIGK